MTTGGAVRLQGAERERERERDREGLCCTGEKCWVMINKGNCWLKIVTEGQGKQKSYRSENKLGLGGGTALMIFATEIHV